MEARVLLTSPDVSNMAKFITQLFDVELGANELDRFQFNVLGQKFIVDKGTPSNGNSTILDIHFNDQDKLNEFYQKVQFVEFRESLGLECTNVDEKGFFLSDPDGRLWRFSIA